MLQVAFDSAAEAMVIIDSQRRIHWANQASASSLVEGVPIQVVNRDLRDLISRLVPNESGQESPALMDPHVQLPSASDQGRFVLELADGRRTDHQLVRWKPVELVQASYLLVTWRDLGPEEQALRQQQQFMVDLSHELRTPLAILTGCLKRLNRFDALPERVSRGIRMSCEEVSRINRLLKTLTLATHLEVGNSLPELVEETLFPLLKQWHERLPDDQRHRVHLEIHSQHSAGRVFVDVNALDLVLDHLLDIGLRDGPEGPPISVAIDADPQICRVVMTGDGFIAAMGQSTRGRSTDTTELELPLVRQLVEAWKGEVICCRQSRTDDDQPCLVVGFTIPWMSAPGSQAVEEADQINPV